VKSDLSLGTYGLQPASERGKVSQMNFFGKSSKKPKKTSTTGDEDEDFHSPRSSHDSRSGSLSPQKKSSKARDENSRAEPASSRSSRNLRKSGKRTSREVDLNEHPLNWPPEHRLSILSNMSEPTPMDIESDGPTAPTSPPPQTNIPAAADTPKINGTQVNGEGPVPPPHKSPASPVAVLTLEDAEAFKTAGNKLYKAGDYKKAIGEYTKGIPTSRDN
jgi:DnaJ family protein C protein 7